MTTVTTPTVSSIKMRFPEFGDATDSAVEFAIEEARIIFGDGTNWSSAANLALVYLCAHYLSCSISNASSGGTGGEEIASESIGRLSITYRDTGGTTSATPAHDDLSSTSYGLRYLSLVQNNFSGAMIV